MIILNRIVWIINLIGAFCLLLSYASPYVNPMIWWVAAFFGLAFPVLFILNLLFVIYWLIQGKLKVFFSAIVLLIGYNHFNKVFKISGESGTRDENTFLIMSMNVKHLGHGTPNPFFDSVLNYVVREQPDILCLQEFPFGKINTKETTLKMISSQAKFRSIKSSRAGTGDIGVALFSKYKMLETGLITFPETNGNCAVWADLIIAKDTVRVYSVHLQSNKLAKQDQFNPEDIESQDQAVKKSKNIIKRLKVGFEKRSEQVGILLESIESSPYPVLIAGDMNDTQLSYTYRKLRGEGKDAFVESGKGAGNTYVGPFPSYRIDYIFLPPAFDSYSYKTGPNWGSDHKLIRSLIKH